MALIPADAGLRLRLNNEQTQTQPVTPAKALDADLPNLVKGQVFTAQIRSILPQNTYVALVAGKQVTLELPEAVKEGDVLELVVVDKSGKGIFAARTQPGATTANPPQTTFSTAGNLLRSLLVQEGDTPEAAPLNRGQPLLDKPPQSAAELVKVLNQAVKDSGLFYEAHQAQWVKGKLSLQQLRQEPQGQQASRTLPTPPQAALSQNAAAAAATAAAAAKPGTVMLVAANLPAAEVPPAGAQTAQGLAPGASASLANAAPQPAQAAALASEASANTANTPSTPSTPNTPNTPNTPSINPAAGQAPQAPSATPQPAPAGGLPVSPAAGQAPGLTAEAQTNAGSGPASSPPPPQAAWPRQLEQQLLLYQRNQPSASMMPQSAATLPEAGGGTTMNPAAPAGTTSAQQSAELAGRVPMPGAEAAAARLPLPTLAQAMPVIPDELRALVQQQLDAAGSQRLLWHGEVWPEQQMQWQIERREQGYRNEDDEEISWQTRLRMITPRLGAMDASLQLGLSGVRITLSAHDAQTAAQMRLASEELEAALAAAGVPLRGLQVRLVENFDTEAGE